MNGAVFKDDTCVIERFRFYDTIEKLREMRSFEYELMKQGYGQGWSRGASIRATRSSKYSMTPLNLKSVRAGRMVSVNGGGRRCSVSGRDCGDLYSTISVLSLVNVERQATIISGGMYPD